jgi:hypothetical protein
MLVDKVGWQPQRAMADYRAEVLLTYSETLLRKF